MIEQARRAPQTVNADWTPVGGVTIHGVRIKEIKNVVIRAGVLTECFRPEWFDSEFSPAHAVYMSVLRGEVSSWHCHRRQNDIIVPLRGQVRIGMYDDRPESPTYKTGWTVNAGVARPSAIFIPPLVWHAIKNPTAEEAAYLVLNDEVFDYEEPDDWILPPGSDSIPHRLD